jgi:hypothetical protein
MLAGAMLAGEQTVDAIKDRCARMLGHRWRWLGPLARRYLKEFSGQTRPRRRDVVAFLVRDEEFEQARWTHRDKLRVVEWLGESQQMQPVKTAKDWDVPQIATLGALAEWLGVQASDLEWFADLKGLMGRAVSGAQKSRASGRNRQEQLPGAKAQFDFATEMPGLKFRPIPGDGSVESSEADGRLGHYHYRVLAKKSGSVRLIEAPKGRLKQMQRWILAGILEQVPAHDAVHGFVKGRSIQTFAAPHVGRRVVLRMDLRDFFPSFRAARVAAFFRTAGYPERVAERLAGVCTNAAPLGVWAGCEVEWETRQMYRRAHLPQGAPYTRYADDLAFSGDAEFERGVERFALHAMAGAMEEGFTVHARKTRVERQGVRQRLAGLVVNERLNVARDEFDRLKAVLTNCVRHGAASQNREGHAAFREHLRGRVGFVELVNAARGAKLRGIFERIVWE